MSTLVIELPNDQLDTLERVARRRNMTINAMLAELLSTIIDDIESEPDSVTQAPFHNTSRDDDPILELGRNPISIDVNDASVNHDRYVYG